MSRISSTKFDIVKFDGSKNFGLWQRRVKDLLVQQGMVKALYRKTTRRNERHGLEGSRSKGCSNDQALFG